MNRFVATLLIALTLLLPAEARADVDYCHDPAFYQEACQAGSWEPMRFNWGGHVYQGCSAHTLTVYGEDGFAYNIIDQCLAGAACHARGFRRPPDTAPSAQVIWDRCFVQHQFTGGGYPCDTVRPPGGVQIYHPVALEQIPDEAVRQAYRRSFHCDGQTTPIPPGITPTRTSTRPAATPTRPRTRTPSGCCDPIPPNPCPPGVPACHPTVTKTVVPPTVPPTNTATATVTSTKVPSVTPSSTPTKVPTHASTPTAVPVPPTPTPTPWTVFPSGCRSH